MKESWTYKKLGEVCDFEGGSQPPKSEWINHPQDGYVRMLQIRDFTKSRNAEIEYVKITKKLRLCKADDILIGRYGASVGKILTGLAGAYNVAIIKSIPDEELISKDYLRRYFESSLFQSILFKVCTSRAAQAGFSKDDIKDELIPIPPLSEQQSIVDYLDSAFAKIDAMKANAEKALNEAKALFQASLKEMLEPKEGWEEKMLGAMSFIQSGFPFKSSQFVKKGQYQVIRMGNVRNGLIRYNEAPVFVDQIDNSVKEKAMLQFGDLIITQTGSRNKRDYGYTVLIEKEGLLLNQRIARIRVKDTITNKYLLYYSWTDYFRDQYFANEGGTVGQGNVGIDAIKNAMISYPPVTEQQSIVATLDSLKSKVDRLQENFDKISQECDALKQAILRQVFE